VAGGREDNDLGAAAGAGALGERVHRTGARAATQATPTSTWRTGAEPSLVIRPRRPGAGPRSHAVPHRSETREVACAPAAGQSTPTTSSSSSSAGHAGRRTGTSALLRQKQGARPGTASRCRRSLVPRCERPTPVRGPPAADDRPRLGRRRLRLACRPPRASIIADSVGPRWILRAPARPRRLDVARCRFSGAFMAHP
jgi:hypothetical protein